VPRITRAQGLEKRPVPVSTTKPSVDQMLRKPTPVDPPVNVDAAGGTAGGSGDGESVPAPTTAELREWARANGHDVSDSGPVPKTVREAYDTAHAG